MAEERNPTLTVPLGGWVPHPYVHVIAEETEAWGDGGRRYNFLRATELELRRGGIQTQSDFRALVPP